MANLPFTVPTNKQQIVDKNGNTTNAWFFFFTQLYNRINPGLTYTVATAKLTTGGTNGTLTFTNGILTAQTQAT